MLGKIKFVKEHYGYILPEDGGQDVHFWTKDVEGSPIHAVHRGFDVEYSLGEPSFDGKPHAAWVRLVEQHEAAAIAEVEPARPRIITDPSPVETLKRWAFLPMKSFKARDGKEYASVFAYLASIALEEEWSFAGEKDYSILRNYFSYTFYRLVQEDNEAIQKGAKEEELKIRISSSYAVFNTGLVDRLYDSIYAIFELNEPGREQNWKFYDFAVPSKKDAGKLLTNHFNPLPAPAQYFSSNYDMLLDLSQEIHWDPGHVILDAIANNRYPMEVLKNYVPKNIEWVDYSELDSTERDSYLEKFARALEEDEETYLLLSNRFDNAYRLALKRVQWNYKAAIPQYYPRENLMSILLPIGLTNNVDVDVALVLTRNDSGSYQGRTVFPLNWAYKSARLVCRPDSDWLSPALIRESSDDEE